MKNIIEYRDYWQEAAKMEAEEHKTASQEHRWQQLNSILCTAIGLGLRIEKTNNDEGSVYQR